MSTAIFQLPKAVPGCNCVVCFRGVAPDGTVMRDSSTVFNSYRLVKVDKNYQSAMTTDELKEFEEKEPKLAEWNAPVQETMWYKSCTKILKLLLKDKRNSSVFMAPVDPVALNIPDYFKVIKHPMDLGTVQQRLDNLVYIHPEQFVNDVRLVFRNAYAYNKKESQVFVMAERLSRAFETEVWRLTGG